ncbi:regulatory protein RecX [Thiomicrorhabdus indica]|uniref:regulatory protein RecX n=1 Tax=Thiomicrorhabdus indica TaxID=2267253 RepID=UPI002AA7B034|nr:regulatory protein RecX [Thiomicrorhabdus indica]
MKDAQAFLDELKQNGQIPDFGVDNPDSNEGFLEPFDGTATAQTALRQEIEARAVSLLAIREHGDKELKRKLKTKFPFSEAVQAKYQLDEITLSEMIIEVVEHCKAQNWQNDERFIEQAVLNLSHKGQGPMKIRQKLQQASSRSDLIEAYLDWDFEDWLETAREALLKKYGNLQKPESRNEQAKRMRFLQSRGFGSDVIWKAFD